MYSDHHTGDGDGGPLNCFNRENLKFGLKLSVCAPITSRVVEIPHEIFPDHVPRGRGDNVCTIIGRSAP